MLHRAPRAWWICVPALLTTSVIAAPQGVSVGSLDGAELDFPYRMVVDGPFEMVLDYDVDACFELNFSDAPPRPFRDAAGQVHLHVSYSGYNCEFGVSGGYTNRFSGPDFDNLTLGCFPVLQSTLDVDPARYRNHEWLGSLWTHDGVVVHGMLHNEYHAHCYAGCVDSSTVFCVPRTLTYARSVDAGLSFSRPGGRNWIGADPLPYPSTNVGVAEPSNILFNHRDGYYYAMILYGLTRNGQPVGPVSIMRTPDPASPELWRAWGGLVRDGGSGQFDIEFVSPYDSPPPGYDPDDHVPWPLKGRYLGLMHQSLTYNSFLDCFVLVGRSSTAIGAAVGLYYSFSQDLVNWSRSKLIDPTVQIPLPGGEGLILFQYPTMFDHDSPSRNFDVTDDTAHLYMTWRQDHPTIPPPEGINRDLVRIPVRFLKY